ncbi:unnamed protein product [Adineta steineri]|uniref:Uncharacterized protein n=1 Tax=Adineta steineri TaxID=433720 RepID=A0A814TLT6_9BILA|nr:unnamed protein product [Adineta steineri]
MYLLGWFSTGNMINARDYHTASVLLNGKVLITGGYGFNGCLNSVELYDSSTGTWTTTSNMTYGRYYHTASVLSNGKVLVIGGTSNDYSSLNSAELYDLSTSTWTITSNMINAREVHTASVLSNGKVLVTGGRIGLTKVITDTITLIILSNAPLIHRVIFRNI